MNVNTNGKNYKPITLGEYLSTSRDVTPERPLKINPSKVHCLVCNDTADKCGDKHQRGGGQ